MTIAASDIPAAVAVGIGATGLMDLWNLLLHRAFGIPSLNYCLLGRWIRHMPAGTFRHHSINAAEPRSGECFVGWIAHYGTGVTFAVGFVLLMSGAWLAQPTLLPALLYGVVTVVFPYFIMQPAFGLGIAASRSPKPVPARLKSLGTHTVFGIGLYLSAVGLGWVLRR